VQVVAQEVGLASLLAALVEHDARHIRVRQAVEAVELATGLDVRHRLDVENKNIHMWIFAAEAQRTQKKTRLFIGRLRVLCVSAAGVLNPGIPQSRDSDRRGRI